MIKRIDDNAYVLNLPEGFGISLIFDVENLGGYKAFDFNPSKPLLDEPTQVLILEGPFLSSLSNLSPYVAEQIDKI